MHCYIKRHIFLLFALWVFYPAKAQYIGDIGLIGGVSYYNGDANSTTPFLESHLAVGGLLRIKLNFITSLKLDVVRATVSGNTENFPNKYPKDVQAQFKRDFWEVGTQLELDFFRYGAQSWDADIKQHTPYILLGPGLAFYDNNDGNTFLANLTLGVGYKFKVLDRLNIGVEWSMRKLFRDNFDVTNDSNEILDDPYGLGYSWIKNNDWYTFAFVFITLDIIKVRGKCTELR